LSKAPQADQRRLLDVQGFDTAMDRATHRREHLEAAVQLQSLNEQEAGARESLAAVRAELGDVQRELARAEEDAAKVKARRERDRGRLDDGAGGAKELVALQHEVEALDRRLVALEDTQLEIMERAEAASKLVETAQAVVERLAQEVSRVGAQVTQSYGEIDTEIEGLRKERTAAAAGLDQALMALYERLRSNRGGIAAAQLRAKRCEGCRLQLTPADLEYIRAASPDELIRCEECGRILVRTEDSGL
jgi:predicted  nucleic acid-binding Zn-ribbon protein